MVCCAFKDAAASEPAAKSARVVRCFIDASPVTVEEQLMQPEREPRPQHYGMRVVVGDAKTHEQIATDLPAGPDGPRQLATRHFRRGAVFRPAGRHRVAQYLREEHAALSKGDGAPQREVDEVVHADAVGFSKERVS